MKDESILIIKSLFSILFSTFFKKKLFTVFSPLLLLLLLLLSTFITLTTTPSSELSESVIFIIPYLIPSKKSKVLFLSLNRSYF
jgi:hypothetical protein